MSYKFEEVLKKGAQKIKNARAILAFSIVCYSITSRPAPMIPLSPLMVDAWICSRICFCS